MPIELGYATININDQPVRVALDSGSPVLSVLDENGMKVSSVSGPAKLIKPDASPRFHDGVVLEGIRRFGSVRLVLREYLGLAIWGPDSGLPAGRPKRRSCEPNDGALTYPHSWLDSVSFLDASGNLVSRTPFNYPVPPDATFSVIFDTGDAPIVTPNTELINRIVGLLTAALKRRGFTELKMKVMYRMVAEDELFIKSSAADYPPTLLFHVGTESSRMVSVKMPPYSYCRWTERECETWNARLGGNATISTAAERLHLTPVVGEGWRLLMGEVFLLLAGVAYLVIVLSLLTGVFVSPISNMIGAVYPLYRTVQLLSKDSPSEITAAGKELLMYWAIFDCLLVAEPFFNIVFFWLPYHNFYRPLIEVFLCLNDFAACSCVYDSCVKPLFNRALQFQDLFITPPVYVKDTGMLRKGEDVPEFREKAKRMAAMKNSKTATD
ncbi:hypothetical protein FOL47_006821 [Perkinsus chesapeaki]|uniref:Receptor expression-enhancing protein 5 n=1 Tax=Perkinsus chesapeaki TaxID=330153 RepID=A0A7J6MYS2_PERCH|nr:hypothetical protein FOL47_006821 [Perkinsus chesapeaki]